MQQIPEYSHIASPMCAVGLERRHSRWYEVLLLSYPVQLVAGLLVTVLLPAALLWGRWWPTFMGTRRNAMIVVAVCFIASSWVLRRIRHYSPSGSMAHVLPVVATVFAAGFLYLFFLRIPYARSLLLATFVLALAWFYGSHLVGQKYARRKYAVIPMGQPFDLHSNSRLELRALSVPDLQGIRYDGIVADLHDRDMTPEWSAFLANCMLANIPVFHARQIAEATSGRVAIDRLSENAAGALLPSPLYAKVKRILDVLGVVVTAPVTIPVMLAAALAIRIDSPGPAIFRQQRVGLGNRDFMIYKFRTMHSNAEAAGARFAKRHDKRITRLGRFLRRSRIDELPQLWNVLKGDMSLIGPRPEQRVFAEQFSHEIPFYVYRHVIRPGITGWAQVMQGYVAGAAETQVKIQYDFYYIKHFSFWLDLLITLKTLYVMLVGRGAR